MTVQFDAATCRALLNPVGGPVEIGGGGFIADWRRWSPRERQEWVALAAEGGILPEGYFDPNFGLPPSMVLAPGGVCYIALSREEPTAPGVAGGAGGAVRQPEENEDEFGRVFGPPGSDLISRALAWLRDLLTRATQLAADVLRTVTETVRTIFDTLTGAAGSVALWLGLGLALALGLYLATRDGGKPRRAR